MFERRLRHERPTGEYDFYTRDMLAYVHDDDAGLADYLLAPE